MKKKWYRNNFLKACLIVFFTVALALAAVGGAFLISMEVQGIRIWGDDGKTYLTSRSLAESVFQSSYEILGGIRAESVYSSVSGDEAEELAVDLLSEEISKIDPEMKTSGLAYSLDDIQKWSQSAWENYEQQIIVCVTDSGEEYYYYKKDFLKMAENGKITFRWDKGSSEDYGENDQEATNYVLGLLQYEAVSRSDFEGLLSVKDVTRNVEYVDIFNWQEALIEEKYLPIGADSFLDAVNSSEEWKGRLSEASSALENTLDVTSDVISRMEVLKQHQEGNTNLTYLYVDLDHKQVYTNKSVYDDFGAVSAENSAVLDKIEKSGAYIIVRPKLADCQSNLNFGDESGLQTWQHTLTQMGISEDFIFAAAVDEEFPIMDELERANENYNRYMSLRPVAGQMLGWAVFLFLISIVWLTIAAGKRTQDEVIHLNLFDRIFTEAAAIGVVCVWLLGLVLGIDLADTFTNISFTSNEFYILAAFEGVYTAVMFLIGYLSLVRRIKAGTLWKDSLLRWILRKCRQLWTILRTKMHGTLEFLSRNTGSKVKMILLFGGFLLLQFILNGIIFSGAGGFMLILMVVDCAAMLYYIRKADGRDRILEGLKRITNGELQYKIPAEKLTGEQKTMAEYINHIGEGLDAAVENSLKNERMKTELITNVSHDIKTPLTSIINYVDLLKRENFTDPKICGYLDILDAKAQRLKVLTEDVVEASKASSGAISLELVNLNFIEMLHQVMGEFEERFQEKNLTLMVHLTDEAVMIRADGRRLWRVLDNVFNNVVKYAMEGTRVYAEAASDHGTVIFSLKNISSEPLNISADELTERFIRGDSSRNTEGSGLGLSIARSLTELQGGEFKLYLDGDLFKVIITFPLVK